MRVLGNMRAIRYIGLLAAALLPSGCSDPTLPGGGNHPAGVVVAAPMLGARPFGVAVNAAGTVYVSRLDNASLATGNANTLSLGTGIAVGNAPTAVAFNPAG